jgi:thymidylate synthase (FAD)
MSNPPGSTPVLDHGFVAPVLQPDSDLKVVNAARVSFHKESHWRCGCGGTPIDEPCCHEPGDYRLSDKDAGLIHYLATHRHWTPFAHIRRLTSLAPDTFARLAPEIINCGGFEVKVSGDDIIFLSLSLAHVPVFPTFGYLFQDCSESVMALKGDFKHEPRISLPWSLAPSLTPATLHIKLPIFVDRQLVTHKVGFVRNEVSRRYLDGDDLPIEFHTPTIWRSRPPKNIKQGSGVEMDYYQHCFDCRSADGDGDTNLSADAVALYEYNERTRCNVAPEQARIVLPLSTYTEHWTTASLRSWARLFHLRSDAHAQHEIQQYARAIDAQLCIMHPEHWPRVRDNR